MCCLLRAPSIVGDFATIAPATGSIPLGACVAQPKPKWEALLRNSQLSSITIRSVSEWEVRAISQWLWRRQRDAQIERQTDRQMDGWMDGWMEELFAADKIHLGRFADLSSRVAGKRLRRRTSTKTQMETENRRKEQALTNAFVTVSVELMSLASLFLHSLPFSQSHCQVLNWLGTFFKEVSIMRERERELENLLWAKWKCVHVYRSYNCISQNRWITSAKYHFEFRKQTPINEAMREL